MKKIKSLFENKDKKEQNPEPDNVSIKSKESFKSVSFSPFMKRRDKNNVDELTDDRVSIVSAKSLENEGRKKSKLNFKSPKLTKIGNFFKTNKKNTSFEEYDIPDAEIQLLESSPENNNKIFLDSSPKTIVHARSATHPDVSYDLKNPDINPCTSTSDPSKLTVTNNRNAEHEAEYHDRLDDLSCRFTGCVELVQNENEKLWNSISEINENIEKLQTQMVDFFSETEDFQNITSSKIAHLENIISQQQQVLTMVDSYFGDLERKWGSPVLRAIIPIVLFILVAFNAVWQRIGHRKIIIPFLAIVLTWYLSTKLFHYIFDST